MKLFKANMLYKEPKALSLGSKHDPLSSFFSSLLLSLSWCPGAAGAALCSLKTPNYYVTQAGGMDMEWAARGAQKDPKLRERLTCFSQSSPMMWIY